VPRIRSVKPGYFTSLDTAGSLSRDCRLHFAGLWTYADDHGRGVDDPRLIKAAVWPLDDDIDFDRVDELQAELEAAGRIVRYKDDETGRRYFEVCGWHDHQKPNRPQDSAYPPPGSDHCTVTEQSVNPHEQRSEDSSPEGRGEEGRGGERDTSRKRSDQATRLPDDWRPEPEPELVDAIGGQEAAKREWAKFSDYWKAKAGKDARKTDWQATWRNWLRRASEGRNGQTPTDRASLIGTGGVT
jgi:hypothetical protein